MAELIVGVAARIIGGLGSVAIQKIGEYLGVKDELAKLANSVSTIGAVLLDAEEQYYQSNQVRDWLQKLKYALHDAEDLLEEILDLQHEMIGSNKVKIFFSGSNPLAFRLKMGPRIKAIRERIDAVAADRRFHLEVRSVDMEHKNEGRKRDRTHGFILKEEVVGRDDDIKAITEVLLAPNEEEEDISIIPIVGIGGLGKTTLAKYVYNDELVGKDFDLKIWVCVSEVFDVESIIKQMMSCASSNGKHENMNMEELQNDLPRVIGGKKYLLVLDDLWNEDREKWDNFKTLLMGGSRGSKILVTTRTKLVAEMTGTVRPYMLECLSEDMSWALFRRMAFKQGGEVKDPDFISIGKEIVSKCKGVPLAIRSVGSMLFFKRTKNEWLHFKTLELSGISAQETSIMPILKLSYNHLPSHLKQCFAYCSLFPKDYYIKKLTLINLWMAQGFIMSTSKDQHLEDIGEEYFMGLVWRNFFQNVAEGEFGTVIGGCTMHDLLNDLAQSVAGEECVIVHSDAANIHERTLHATYDSGLNLSDAVPTHLLKAKNLRTFNSAIPRWVFRKTEQAPLVSEAAFEEIISIFPRLRVLDLHRMAIKKVPRSISKLKHLRYLDLSGNVGLERLPSCIVELRNLQTLKLEGCSELKELPKDLKKLVCLRHLDIKYCRRLNHMPKGLGGLTSLHTLTDFVIAENNLTPSDAASLSELSRLNNLRGDLKITILGCPKDAKGANLIEKPFLQSLSLRFHGDMSSSSETSKNHQVLIEGLQPHPNLQTLEVSFYWGTRFPSWMMNNMTSCLPNLVDVVIKGCQNCKHLPRLGQLSKLKSLTLSELPEIELIEDKGPTSDPAASSSSGGLQLLENQNQSDVHHLAFANLSKLAIAECPKLTSLPLLPNLKQLRLYIVDESLVQQLLELQGLTHLQIGGLETLTSVPEELLQKLTSLGHLYIQNCPRMINLSRGISHLKKLTELWIRNCEDLDMTSAESVNAAKGLGNLRSLTIIRIPKLVSLPEWLRDYCANLKHLSIVNCVNLTALPDWIGEVGLLASIEIKECPGLTSLPEGISRLRSLRTLRIVECPLLQEACSKGTGKDWCKITHVPQVTLESLESLDERSDNTIGSIYYNF